MLFEFRQPNESIFVVFMSTFLSKTVSIPPDETLDFKCKLLKKVTLLEVGVLLAEAILLLTRSTSTLFTINFELGVGLEAAALAWFSKLVIIEFADNKGLSEFCELEIEESKLSKPLAELENDIEVKKESSGKK